MRLFLLILALALVPLRPTNAQSGTGAGNTAKAAPPVTLEQGFPAFLPDYYRPALAFARDWRLSERTITNGTTELVYVSADQVSSLTVGYFPCEGPACTTTFDNVFRYLNNQATANAGRFLDADSAEMLVTWRNGLSNNVAFAARLPASLLLLVVSDRLDRPLDPIKTFGAVRNQVRRQQYEVALQAGNVEIGRWETQARHYASDLMKEGRTETGLKVLRDVIANAPQDYDAQLMLAQATADPSVRRQTAQIIFDNAEEPRLTSEAAKLLGVVEPGIASLPPVPEQASGLRVILIPLPPCDIRLVVEAAGIYSKITGVPVTIARLAEPWDWGAPDRIPNERSVRQVLDQQSGAQIDFSGWTLARYQAALLKGAEGKDAFTRYSTGVFVDKLEGAPGQYAVERFLHRFLELTGPHRSTDTRTMYVGVTEANIYAGDTNFLFSLYGTTEAARGSILSYAMMRAAATGEPFQSRHRLAERLAKEMVPASLHSLGIPRPADPTDPYSYSDGLDRLAQKTLILSEPTREALDKLR